MRKLLLFSISALFLGQTFATTVIELPKTKLNAAEIFLPIGKTGEKISLMELSTISMDALQGMTGRKMNSMERMAFKTAQKKLRKDISADGTIEKNKLARFFIKRDGDTGFHVGGFVLGLFLSFIGVLIAYLINDDYKHNRVKWAWIGCGISVVINVIYIIAVLKASGN